MNGENNNYTVEQLIALANTGSCATGGPSDNGNKVCADGPSTGAFLDPSKLSLKGCKTVCFTVKNNGADAKYFGFGGGFVEPGLSPLYPKSEFEGNYGVDNAGFTVTGMGITVGASALALQSFQRKFKNTIFSALRLVRVADSDPILNQSLVFERYNLNSRVEGDVCPPICDMCGGNNSNFTTVSYKMGLKVANEGNAWGIVIPGVVGDDPAVEYKIEADVAFIESLYGYVPQNC